MQQNMYPPDKFAALPGGLNDFHMRSDVPLIYIASALFTPDTSNSIYTELFA